MADVYALLVGIDDYQATVPALKGCVNDVADVRRYLDENVGSRAVTEELLNARATRDAVVEAFRGHLGQAGPGDTALFWFSGHGSLVPVPPEWWHLEPGGDMMQTILCVDSRCDGVPDLLDKELAVLIREVASAGAHVAVVLDCCHAGGATRMPPSAQARFVEPHKEPPDPATLTAGLRACVSAGELPRRSGGPDHVALAACQDHQLAHELPDRHGRPRGVFSLGLLAELRRPGAARTYRDLIAATRGYVENVVDRQVPVLFPHEEPIVDQPFLGGHVRPPATTMTMRERRGSWILDSGSCHGFTSGPDPARIAVHGSEPIQECRVVQVLADRSIVEAIGWTPVPGLTYPVVLSSVALPATSVTIGGDDGDDAAVAERVGSAVRTAGPGGQPSPHLRLVRRADPNQLANLVVTTPSEGRLTIRSSDGGWLADSSPDPDGTGHPEIVGRLEHIAKWRCVRRLANPLSRLSGLVRVEMMVPQAHEYVTPRARPGLRPGGNGAIELEYELREDGWSAPSVFIRLDNTSDRRLYCVLLDLTDRFRIHASLFPGAFIAPASSAAVGEGDPIEFALPPGRRAVPGARVRDWLLLIVSEDEINSDHFALSRLGEPPPDRTRSPLGLMGIVESLALSARYRDAERRPRMARDWWTSVVPIVTRVPG